MDKIDQEIERLNEAIRNAHETMKDLKAARSELNELLREINDRLDREVTRQLEGLGKVTQTAITNSEDRIMKRFAALEKMVFEASAGDGESVETLFRKMMERKSIGVLLKVAEQEAAKLGFNG